ncbi:hypothetical protein NPX13_g4399 [Xylaria arbuscula]|uniref:Uncharacterized protein n=1 Tax=Xylaria arbuscula TaxID=114810 RepID=A0A9W8NGG5_9PEZI|nr:hypothetical protein NPX13_g4399 [Xylaria arbuscula]
MSNGEGNSDCVNTGRLPPGGGPSLREFRYAGAPIEWIKRLDDEDREDNQAFIYKVRIASRNYALKVFKFSSPKDDGFYWGIGLQHELPMKKAIFYTDPFYAECRAYGRIEDGRVDRHSRVPRGLDLETDVIDDDVYEALEGDTRVRAIVKHLDESPKSLHARNIGRAWTSVRLLKKSLKIYNMDIRADNFIGHRIVDFGSSWTEPHELLRYLDKRGKIVAGHKRAIDTQHFDDMIEEEEIPTRLRVVPWSRHQLRSRGDAPWAGEQLPKRRRKNKSQS